MSAPDRGPRIVDWDSNLSESDHEELAAYHVFADDEGAARAPLSRADLDAHVARVNGQ